MPFLHGDLFPLMKFLERIETAKTAKRAHKTLRGPLRYAKRVFAFKVKSTREKMTPPPRNSWFLSVGMII